MVIRDFYILFIGLFTVFPCSPTLHGTHDPSPLASQVAGIIDMGSQAGLFLIVYYYFNWNITILLPTFLFIPPTSRPLPHPSPPTLPSKIHSLFFNYCLFDYIYILHLFDYVYIHTYTTYIYYIYESSYILICIG